MHFRSIIHVVGLLLVVTGSSMFLPAICSMYYHETDLLPIIYSSLIAITLGLPSWWHFQKHNELHIKDSIFIAVFGWLLVSAIETWFIAFFILVASCVVSSLALKLLRVKEILAVLKEREE